MVVAVVVVDGGVLVGGKSACGADVVVFRESGCGGTIV